MRLGPFDFRPGLWPTVATLLLLPLLTGLGVWQLERASWKQGLVDMHEGQGRLSPVSLEVASSGGDMQYRRVFARGHYDMEQQLLLDNRTFNGHAGYHVLTPLKLADSGNVVLVNRGWVPVGNSRAVLPEIPGTSGEVLVEATIKLPPEKFFRLGEMDEPNASWPKVSHWYYCWTRKTSSVLFGTGNRFTVSHRTSTRLTRCSGLRWPWCC
jgi:surfeit locus 1 family protein